MSASALPVLSLLESRVLGVLVEKELTTPDYYPLTLNALIAGCNQKTSRNPVLNAGEDEVQMALDALKRQTLVIESSGASGRVWRYAHNMGKVIGVPPPIVALLAALMLKGPQTPGELRIGCDRLYRFPDISSLEAYLEEMAIRPQGALAVRLPKHPGEREHRYAHLLSGPVDIEADATAPQAEGVTTGEIAALKANLAGLQEEVGQLRILVERLYSELGVAR
ncbi:MAG TPA: YceH family protein [Rhodocyclaceae bacterium]|nr:YceH family protein [Rhodocyclaceae bacterium]